MSFLIPCTTSHKSKSYESCAFRPPAAPRRRDKGRRGGQADESVPLAAPAPASPFDAADDLVVSLLHPGQPLAALREVLEWQRRRRDQQGGGQGGDAARRKSTAVPHAPIILRRGSTAGVALGLQPPPPTGAMAHTSSLANVASAVPPIPPESSPGVPASATASDGVAGLLQGFDLSGLLRCVHIHKV